MAINTVADLRTHLQWAIRVELTTIPTYLYAFYSIKDSRSAAAIVFREIVIEEMLHVALASNLLVSVGGIPASTTGISFPAIQGQSLTTRPVSRSTWSDVQLIS